MRCWPISVLLMVANSALATPGTLTHQGRMLDAFGVGVNGSMELVFTLHTEPDGGPEAVWTEQDTVVLQDGYYFTTLGDGTPLGALDLTGTSYWLQLSEPDGPIFSPRTPLASVPSALSLVGGFARLR